MAGLSTLIRKHRLLALWLIAMALAMKAAMPAGYMLAKQDKVLTVLICADASGAHLSKAITIPAAGKAEGGARSADTCPYASLALASLGASDAPFVALAIAFMLLLGFAPVRIPRLVGNAFILPPLRGPPALI
jgi:hypothetical protein